MNERIRKKLKFETFAEFCNRADEILSAFETAVEYCDLSLKDYKNYVYNKHIFSDIPERDIVAKDKCWLWLMSYKYEPMLKNDLFSTLGWLGNKRV